MISAVLDTLDTNVPISGIAGFLQQAGPTGALPRAWQGRRHHPEDDLVLAAAVSARADYRVTGDSKLQLRGRYQGVIILSPRAFLDLLTVPAAPD